MQEKISIVGLIMDASFIVQLVMLALLVASIISWYLIFQRSSFFRGALLVRNGAWKTLQA